MKTDSQVWQPFLDLLPERDDSAAELVDRSGKRKRIELREPFILKDADGKRHYLFLGLNAGRDNPTVRIPHIPCLRLELISLLS